jgi:hypothetical protein
LRSIILSLGIILAVPGSAHEPAYSPRQLYRSNQLDGQQVAIGGFVTNGRCIFQSRSRYAQWRAEWRANRDSFDPRAYDDDAITILGPLSLLDNLNRLARHDLIIHGTFRIAYLDGHRIDPHACGRAAIVIDEAELRRLVGRGH